MIRVLIVEEMGLLRGALQAYLSNEPDVQVVGDHITDGDLVEVVRQERPDVLVVDIDPLSGDVLNLIRRLGEDRAECAVVALTGNRTPIAPQRLLLAHVSGFLTKSRPPTELVELIRSVASGERLVDRFTALSALSAAGNPLSHREREVLNAAAEGLQSKEIARRLYVAPGTVRNHLSAILRKTGSSNRWEAIQRAREANWL